MHFFFFYLAGIRTNDNVRKTSIVRLNTECKFWVGFFMLVSTEGEKEEEE